MIGGKAFAASQAGEEKNQAGRKSALAAKKAEEKAAKAGARKSGYTYGKLINDDKVTNKFGKYFYMMINKSYNAGMTVFVFS